MKNDAMPKRDLYEVLQKSLVEARQAQSLTQTDVATRLGKPQSYVSKYEIGERRLDVIEFLEVCQALSVKPLTILKKLELE
jgi:transcriptional regulator with XRE-family HTH domain